MKKTKKDLHWLVGGDMAHLIKEKDWSSTPLGPIDEWPPSLKTTVSLCLSSNFPINVMWGPEAIQIYNDGYKPICGAFYKDVLGADYRKSWESAWPAIGEAFEKARGGQTTFLVNQRMFLERNGYPEETFFTFSTSPIRDENGSVAGLFHPVTETTAQILSERRTRALRDLAGRAGKGHSVKEVCQLAIKTLNEYAFDIPFASFYLYSGKSKEPDYFSSTDAINRPFPVSKFLDLNSEKLIEDFKIKFGTLQCGEYPEAIEKGFVFTLRQPGSGEPLGLLVLGASSRLPFNDEYRVYFEMVLSTIMASINGAMAYEQEKRRAETLAELDRSKTEFFSNVSHEFRTPLTLILGPLEDLLSGKKGKLSKGVKEETQIIHRNSLRLLKLVNSLLDFSKLEASRAQANFVLTNLSELTKHLASHFQSAIESAGMKFRVNISEDCESVFVDQDMFEKIVLNLISNAFKYTLSGEISISLKLIRGEVELGVSDTGTGIAPSELPKIFQRFHRVQGALGRTHEGSGIGLALVQELVKLHGGEVTVESQIGEGSTFRVRLPLGFDHLPKEQIGQSQNTFKGTNRSVEAFLGEAKRWLSDKPTLETKPSIGKTRQKIVLADDNGDMREYVCQLLAPDYDVISVNNGQLALEAIATHRPDLVLSDIMMPVMDGITLTKRLRADEFFKIIPVILLSARAGEEAKAWGIETGADDYLVKPFSSRELLARVKTQLNMASARRESARNERENELLLETVRGRDEFMSIASHELRTPITSLKLQTQVLNRIFKDKAFKDSSSVLEQAISISLRQINRLTELVEDLLDVSRIQSGKLSYNFEDFDLGKLISHVVERFSVQLDEAKCKVRLDLEKSLTGLWDQSRIDQVLINLLSNCAKYAAGSEVAVSLTRDNNFAKITVEDKGPGIPKERQPFVFERFQRATSARNISGLGLGLFIVKGIVAAHHGEVTLHSELGQGARFVVKLPIIESENVMIPSVSQI